MVGTPETLILKTRLRHGRISYDEEDVEQRLEGWAAPQAIANHLLEEWQSTDNVELLVYQENKTGNLHTVVNKNESTKMRRLSDSLKGALQRISNSPVLLLATRLRRGRIMRNLGHEKKSQHVLITSVILRQSFLSAMKRIISTRTVGMCPCSYF